jgi:hypothetical protein
MTNDSSDPIGFQEEKVTKEDVVNGSEGTDIETAVGTKEELDTSTDSLETSDNTESLLQQKMVNCKRVVNEMMRLSVQAKQMYKEMRELANSNGQELVNESGFDIINDVVSTDSSTLPTNSNLPLAHTQPPISAFSPGRRRTEGKVQVRVLQEMEQSFHHLRLSMASISNILGSDTSPATSPSTTGTKSDKSSSIAISKSTATTFATDTSASSSSSKKGEEDVDSILEKYSDRIADMVSEKLSARMSASMSMSASTHSLGLTDADAMKSTHSLGLTDADAMNISSSTSRNGDT